MSGPQKTEYLVSLVYEGALEPLVRRVAVDLCTGLHRDAHLERLERLHRFVRDSVPYHREPVEMFHTATQVLLEGGDCDDKVILLCAMAWSLRYPFHVEPYGDPEAPSHYTCAIGTPPCDEPTGDASTVWRWYETTVDALPGEHTDEALRRLGGARE
jgi:hypothetical protein